MVVNFLFEPQQLVLIKAYGLFYKGRVWRCYVNCSGTIFYDVEFAADGKIESRDFLETDLEAL